MTLRNKRKSLEDVVKSAPRMLTVAALIVSAGVSYAQATGPIVQAPVEAIQGIVAANTEQFLGVPYAAPPVGVLRFAPPQPASFSGVLQATHLPPSCPQPASPGLSESVTEDCLYLNIYAPTGARPGTGSPLPVMVWVHGGAYYNGTGNQYDGSTLAQDGVIVITINYRLGFLGFLAHPALDAEIPSHASGDYGLMDQQAALAWVKANISAFGGDPERVTLFGQSSGGQAVFDQLVSPTAAGLFQQVAIESGAFDVPLPTLASADAGGVISAQALGCASTTDATCLRALPASAFVAAEAQIPTQASGNFFQPNIGPALLPIQPFAAISGGDFNHVPVLQGSNHDEGRFFTAVGFDFANGPLTSANYGTAVSSIVGAQFTPLVEQFYPLSAYASPDLAFSAVFTDTGFACSAREFSQLLSLRVPVYAYEFADDQAGRLILPPDPFLNLGASHVSELPFLWPSRLLPGAVLTPEEQVLAAEMRAAWTNFAKGGNPNGSSVSRWPAYSIFRDQFKEFVPGGSPLNRSFGDFHKCALWEPLLTYRALQQ